MRNGTGIYIPEGTNYRNKYCYGCVVNDIGLFDSIVACLNAIMPLVYSKWSNDNFTLETITAMARFSE